MMEMWASLGPGSWDLEVPLTEDKDVEAQLTPDWLLPKCVPLLGGATRICYVRTDRVSAVGLRELQREKGGRGGRALCPPKALAKRFGTAGGMGMLSGCDCCMWVQPGAEASIRCFHQSAYAISQPLWFFPSVCHCLSALFSMAHLWQLLQALLPAPYLCSCRHQC